MLQLYAYIALGGVLATWATPAECKGSATQTVAFILSWPVYVVLDCWRDRRG